MICFEKTEVVGFEPALRGMRNPKNSWDRSDSEYAMGEFIIGPNDEKLAKILLNGGPVHSKFMRMIVCYVDITAPLYWWKEHDTYRNGVEKNSCSTMHKIQDHALTMDDFSTEQLGTIMRIDLASFINDFNGFRIEFLKEPEGTERKKKLWWQMIQMLPTNFNQKRTVMMSYEALRNMYRWRRNHKLDEWVEFCRWIEELPNSWLITYGISKDDE